MAEERAVLKAPQQSRADGLNSLVASASAASAASSPPRTSQLSPTNGHHGHLALFGGGSSSSRQGTPPNGRRAEPVSAPAGAMQQTSAANSALVLMRRELGLVESRTAAQLGRLQDSSRAAQERLDRLQAAAVQRLEQKLATYEASQSKIDRRLSEMSGALRGMSDEMQAQIRRADSWDGRLWEARHQLEEEMRVKCVELAEQTQQAASRCKVLVTSQEDSVKRLTQRVQRLESLVDGHIAESTVERRAYEEETRSLLLDLKARMDQLEDVQHGHLAVANAAMRLQQGDDKEDQRHWELQRQVADVVRSLDHLKEGTHGEDGWCSRVEQMQVSLQTLRSKVDKQDALHQTIDDRLRAEWELKIQRLGDQLQDQGSKGRQWQERVSELETWAKATDICIEEIVERTGGLGGFGTCDGSEAGAGGKFAGEGGGSRQSPGCENLGLFPAWGSGQLSVGGVTQTLDATSAALNLVAQLSPRLLACEKELFGEAGSPIQSPRSTSASRTL
eukprot:TRINITY_DN50907_c0_g1_i1.p1 TRINITY_DN50907_c0_g1~~TRINITY_DN50907_c0_g1_i1.p1  ORF type:complete len:505 (+),score=161.44 TRINITY_DN50907_c0_g1_i1:198-1712(+)